MNNQTSFDGLDGLSEFACMHTSICSVNPDDGLPAAEALIAIAAGTLSLDNVGNFVRWSSLFLR